MRESLQPLDQWFTCVQCTMIKGIYMCTVHNNSKGFTCVKCTMIKGIYMCTLHNDQRDLHVYIAQWSKGFTCVQSLWSKGFTCVQCTMIKGIYMCTVHNNSKIANSTQFWKFMQLLIAAWIDWIYECEWK